MLLSFLGPPCSGKGTHTRILKEKYNFKIMGAGDLLRDAAKTDESIAQTLSQGHLVDVNLIWKLIENKTEEYRAEDEKSDILFDGYPREIEQAKVMTDYIKENKLLLHIINFCVPDELLFERMQSRLMCDNCGNTSSFLNLNDVCPYCGKGKMIRRSDDNEETLKERIRVYNSNLSALKEFCLQYHCWIDIDGDGTIDEVEKRLQDAIMECRVK